MSRSLQASSSSDRGFALLIVLWSLVLTALLGTQIVAAGRTEVQLAGNLRSQAALEAAADGAVHQSVFRVLGNSRRSFGAERYHFERGSLTLDVRIDNLAGRVNPNVAPPELLRELLMQLGLDSQRAVSLTDALLDWSTPGQNPRPHGAKAAEYRSAGRSYGPTGAPFQTVDELGAVLGMTPDLLAALRPHLTLWWDEDPDPVFADAVVLAALRSLGAETPSADPQLRKTLDITASASAPDGKRFTRHAVVEFSLAGAGGRPWRILQWDAPAP